jgi:dTDP-4-dehydrorhamnose 3,5-epimerase
LSPPRELSVAGAYLLEADRLEDERGFYARIWRADELETLGIDTAFVQSAHSFNRRAGTLRGLHWQVEPHAEAKLLMCTKGRVFDVIVDVRPSSPSFGRWAAAELAEGDLRMLYVPTGCAHGFQTLDDACAVFYSSTAYHSPEAERGLLYDDPAIGIGWPRPVTVMSEKDRSFGDVDLTALGRQDAPSTTPRSARGAP